MDVQQSLIERIRQGDRVGAPMLAHLDTGQAPVPDLALNECAECWGLPCEVQPGSLERVRLAIGEALSRSATQGKPS